MAAERQGWRHLIVARRVRESANVVSLHLAAADGAPLPAFEPGQFLTFRIIRPDGRSVPRNYSISSDPADQSHYRISVKREAGGIGSGHMHDHLVEGATIEASGPKGQFVLDAATRRAVILLAGGIGITPLLAMAYRLAADGQRPTFLIHACQDDAVRPFAGELAALVARTPNLRVVSVIERPAAGASAEFTGRVSRAMLQRILPIDDYEAYLCGPKPFMQAMFDMLIGLGLPENRIAYEFFGPAETLRAGASAVAPAPVAPTATAPDETGAPRITFALSGLVAPWDGKHRTLLDFAEANGLQPAFSCRNGICNTCLSAIEGEVRYVEEPLDPPAKGQALLCCSVPDGALTVRI